MAAVDDALRLIGAPRGEPEGLQAWALDRASNTLIRIWDQEAVVYDGRSSSTHLLSAAALAVYDALRDLGSATPTAILAHLDGGSETTEPTEEEALALRDILDSLQQCGLAESRAL